MTKILVYFLFVWILVICIGTLMFIMEGTSSESAFSDLPTSIYWAIVTMTTVGYGDIYPISSVGRLISIISSLVGIAIIALPSGIITAGYLDELRERKESKKNTSESAA